MKRRPVPAGGLFSIRLFAYGSSFSGSGICDEEIVTYNDPFVAARRALQLDEMAEEGCGYTRAEVWHTGIWPGGDLKLGVVRLSAAARRKWQVIGAIVRGVRNSALRREARELGVAGLMEAGGVSWLNR